MLLRRFAMIPILQIWVFFSEEPVVYSIVISPPSKHFFTLWLKFEECTCSKQNANWLVLFFWSQTYEHSPGGQIDFLFVFNLSV